MKVDPAADDGTIKAAFRRSPVSPRPRGDPACRARLSGDPRGLWAVQAPAGTAGFGTALDVLGLELGLAVDADIGRGVARRPKPPPRKGPPRRPSGRW